MPNLRDPTFLAIIGILVAVIIPIAIYLRQRNIKRLVYLVQAETPLLSVDDAIKGKIKITFGRKNIENIYLVLLKIENRGNVEIKSADYDQPIIFSFPGSEMISAETVEVSPKNLKPILLRLEHWR